MLVRARSTGKVSSITVGFNVRGALGPDVHERGPFQFVGEMAHLISDGIVHSYLMRTDWSWGEWKGPWHQLGFEITAEGHATLEILSVSVIPAAADYAGARVGVKTLARRGIYRRCLYTHAPGTQTPGDTSRSVRAGYPRRPARPGASSPLKSYQAAVSTR